MLFLKKKSRAALLFANRKLLIRESALIYCYEIKSRHPHCYSDNRKCSSRRLHVQHAEYLAIC